MNFRCFSPPVRWGLLDFMVAYSASSPSSLLPRPPSSPSSSCCPVPSVSRQPPCPVSAGNRDHRRSVFPAGPQPRPSLLSVPSRTSTATICTQCSLPDLDRGRNNFSHDRILSSLKRCLSGIALMFGPRAGLARPRGGFAGARYYPVHWARLLHVSLPWQDFYAMYLDTYTSTIFTGCWHHLDCESIRNINWSHVGVAMVFRLIAVCSNFMFPLHFP